MLCKTNRGSRERSAAFPDQAIAPTSSGPAAKYGSIGLIRGDPSRRTVPSTATPAAFRRVMPRRAISGAPSSKSCQLAGTPVKIAAPQPVGCGPQPPQPGGQQQIPWDSMLRDRDGKTASGGGRRPCRPTMNTAGGGPCCSRAGKRDGTTVGTPVHIALGTDGSAYFRTWSATGKAKRMRNFRHVWIAPCTTGGKATGPQRQATALLLTFAAWIVARSLVVP
jgi:hypothetical protein